MNQGFKLRFDEMRENNPAAVSGDENKHGNEATEKESIVVGTETYHQPGHIHNVCFVWPEGRRLFLSYSYMVSSELDLSDDTNAITLGFTSHLVTIKGYRLESLYLQLMDQTARVITAIDPRYVEMEEEIQTAKERVLSITVEKVQ